MIELDSVLQRHPNTPARATPAGYVAMFARDPRVVKLNRIGAFILECARQPLSAREMAMRLCREYSVDFDTAFRDLREYAERLTALHLLLPPAAGAAAGVSTDVETPRPRGQQMEDSEVYLKAMTAQVLSGRPWAATFELTHLCPLKCRYCYLDKPLAATRRADEMRTEEWVRVLGELEAEGAFLLTLTGGEPLVYPGLPEILAEATRRDFAVRVFTSLACGKPQDLLDFARHNVIQVETSVHGSDAATHDAFTGVPGSFDRMLAAVRLLRGAGIPVVMKTCWTRHNRTQYAQVLDLVTGLGAVFRGTCFVTAASDGTTANTDARMSDAELHAFMLDAFRYGQTVGTGCGEGAGSELPGPEKGICGAGRVGFRVDPWGDVFPCVEWQLKVGNVRQAPVRGIWTTSPDLVRIREYRYRDLDLDDVTPYDRSWGGCSVCPGANLKEKGNCLKVSEEGKRLTRVMHQARKGEK